MKLSDIALSNDPETYPMRVRHALFTPEDITPLAAYYSLREVFGSPNKKPESKETQWAYSLRAPGAFLEISDWKGESWSIAVYGDSNLTISRARSELENRGATDEEISQRVAELTDEFDWRTAERVGREFLKLLAKQAKNYSDIVNKHSKEASSFVLQNPFVIYWNSAVNLLENVTDTSSVAQEYYRSAFFLFIAAFEGLLNLIYELYVKYELRDDRIYERLSREQIDIKVRLAPLYCACFSEKVIDHNSEAFKRFHSIVNLRNDFIHANLTKPMRRAVVEEDNYSFIVESTRRDKYGLPKSITDLSYDDLERVRKSIDEMTSLLVGTMTPRFRHEFRRVMKEEYIQVRIEDGEMIIVTLK